MESAVMEPSTSRDTARRLRLQISTSSVDATKAFTRFTPDECRNYLAAAGYDAYDPT